MVKQKLFTILVFTIIGLGTSWANPDSLFLVIERQNTNAAKLEILQKGIYLNKELNPDLSLLYAKKAFEIAKNDNDLALKAEAYRLMGYGNFVNFAYDSAIYYLEKGFSLVPNDHHANYFILLNLADAYWYKGEFDKSLPYYQKAENSVTFINNPSELANITINIADYYRQKGDFKQANEIYIKAIEYAKQDSTQSQLPKAYNNMAIIYYHLGDYYTELDNYFKAIEAAERINELKKVGLYYCNVAEAYANLGDFDKATIYAQKGIFLSKEANQLRYLMYCYHMLGIIYLKQDSLQQSKSAFLESIRINETLKDKRYIARNLGKMGLVELKIGNLKPAIEYFEFALNAQDEIKERKFKISDLLGLARAHFKMGNYQKAEKYKNEAQDLSKQLDIKTGIAESYLLTSDLYKVIGNNALALSYYKLYDSIGNLLTKEDQARYLANLEKLQISKKQEIENLMLKKNMEQQSMIIDKGRTMFAIVLVAFIVLAVIFFFIFWLLKKNQSAKRLITEQNTALTQKHEELTALSEQQENLMHLVVHDLKSPLNKIEGLVSILKMEGELNSGQKDVVRMLEQISKKGKEFISDLLGASQLEHRSKELRKEFFDLNELLKEVKDEFSVQAYKKAIELELDTDIIEISVYTDKELLFHVLSNLVSNAIKFSSTNKRVELKSRLKDGVVSIIVKDQGQGFTESDIENMFQKFQRLSAQPTASEGSTGLGLFLTKKLLESLGGEITLESEERKGSTFTISFKNLFIESVS